MYKRQANGLAPGVYELVETSAPEGYTLDSTPVRFEIEARAAGAPAPVAIYLVNQKEKPTEVTVKVPPDAQSPGQTPGKAVEKVRELACKDPEASAHPCCCWSLPVLSFGGGPKDVYKRQILRKP